MKQISNIKHSWFNPLHRTVTRYNQEWPGLAPGQIRYIGGTIRVYLISTRWTSIFGQEIIKERMDSYVYTGTGQIEDITYIITPLHTIRGNTILATGDLTYLEVAGVVLVDKR